MCLDFEMIVMLFLVWIVAPIIFVAGTIYVVIKIADSKNLK
jgi:hypothetical protein